MTNDRFSGFSLPRGTFLPPEFGELLPLISKIGELKVLLVVLMRYLRPGLDAQALTFDEIQQESGIRSRETVTRAVQRLCTDGVLERIKVGRSYRYEPVLQSGLKFRLQRMHESSHESFTSATSSSCDEHASEMAEISRRVAVREALTAKCGVAAWVAENIALQRDPAYVERHIAYTLYAQRRGLIKRTTAAYVVASIRDDWQAPLGFDGEEKRRWYSDEEYQTFFLQEGDADVLAESGD